MVKLHFTIEKCAEGGDSCLSQSEKNEDFGAFLSVRTHSARLKGVFLSAKPLKNGFYYKSSTFTIVRLCDGVCVFFGIRIGFCVMIIYLEKFRNKRRWFCGSLFFRCC